MYRFGENVCMWTRVCKRCHMFAEVVQSWSSNAVLVVLTLIWLSRLQNIERVEYCVSFRRCKALKEGTKLYVYLTFLISAH